MKHLLLLVALTVLLLSGCMAWSKSSLLQGSQGYPPSQTVDVLSVPPEREHEIFALIEAQGGKGVSLPQLIEEMKKSAKKLGADAIIPYMESRTPQQQSFAYNPWLGGYQTFSSGSPDVILRGYAVKYK